MARRFDAHWELRFSFLLIEPEFPLHFDKSLYGRITVPLRLGTSPTGMRCTSFIVLASMAGDVIGAGVGDVNEFAIRRKPSASRAWKRWPHNPNISAPAASTRTRP